MRDDYRQPTCRRKQTAAVVYLEMRKSCEWVWVKLALVAAASQGCSAQTVYQCTAKVVARNLNWVSTPGQVRACHHPYTQPNSNKRAAPTDLIKRPLLLISLPKPPRSNGKTLTPLTQSHRHRLHRLHPSPDPSAPLVVLLSLRERTHPTSPLGPAALS